MVHVLSGKWPFPGEAVRTNPKNPNELIAVSEFDRRESTIRLIKVTHQLISLIKKCLNNSPSLRPTACEIYEQVSTVAKDSPPSFNNKAVMLETIKVLREEKETMRIEKDEMRVENDTLIMERDIAVAENAALTLEVEKLQEEMSEMNVSKELLQSSLQSKEREIDGKSQEFLSHEASLMSKVGSLQNDLHRAHAGAGKYINLFTTDFKFSISRRSTIDVPITLPGHCINVAVCIGSDAYMRYNHNSNDNINPVSDHGLLHYNCNTDTWRQLPLPPVKSYGLGQLFEKLLAVGGLATSDIYEFDEVSKQWVKSTTIPPMPTARSLTTVASWKSADVSALIVCGGNDQKLNTLAVVEIFHSVTLQWHVVAPSLWLPRPRQSMKHSIHQNTLYLMGGEKMTRKRSVFCISIPDLLESCFQQQSSGDQTFAAKWQTLLDVPAVDCYPICLYGQLMAVQQVSMVIYIYCRVLSTWIKLGGFPTAPIWSIITEASFPLSIPGSDDLIVLEHRLADLSRNKKLLHVQKYTTIMHFTATRVGIAFQ